MKKALAILSLGAFFASASTAAVACMYDKVVETKPAPITTALDSQPSTPKPKPGS